MKNFFKVLSLSVVAAFMLASCEEEEAQIEPRHEKNIPSYADKIIEIPNPIVKKVVYDVSYASFTIENNPVSPFSPNADPGFSGDYWTVTITSPTTGEKQQWLLKDVATNKIALRSHQSDDLTGADHGYYYQWNGGADLTISEINSLTSTSGFQIPDMDDIYKLDRIVGSHQEAVVALNLTFDGNYVPGSNTWHYNTDYLCFWLNMDNDNYPDAGVFYQIDKEDYNGKIVYTNVESMRCNLRLVRDLN